MADAAITPKRVSASARTIANVENDNVCLLTRRASLKPQTVNVEERNVEIVWSTGAPVRRRDMAG